MGASVSSNTAKAIAKVANSVSNSTNVTSNQVNSVQQRINFDDCYIDMSGDIDIKTASTMIAKSKQMVTALQQSHIQNDIAQKMLQSATSTVGALPMGGFAEANNFSSSLEILLKLFPKCSLIKIADFLSIKKPAPSTFSVIQF